MSHVGKITGRPPPLQQNMSYGGPQPPRPTHSSGAAYNPRSSGQPYGSNLGQPRQQQPQQQSGMYPGQLPPPMGGRYSHGGGGGGGYSPYGYQQTRRQDLATGMLNGLACCCCLDLCFC